MGVKRCVGRVALSAAVLSMAAWTVACNDGSITAPSPADQRPLGAAILDGPNPYAGRPLVLFDHDNFPTDIDFEIKDWDCVESVTEEYAGAGIHFSGGTVAAGSNDCLNTAGFPPHSPLHTILDVSDGIFNMAFDFTTDAVGLRYITAGSLDLSCFTATDVLVGSASAPGSNVGGPHGTLIVEGDGIRKCTVAGPTNQYQVDDLFFGVGFEGGGGGGGATCREQLLASRTTIISTLTGLMITNPNLVSIPFLIGSVQALFAWLASFSDDNLALFVQSAPFGQVVIALRVLLGPDHPVILGLTNIVDACVPG